MNVEKTIKEELSELLAGAVCRTQQLGKLPAVPLPEITLEHPQNPEHGDYASSFSLKLARAVGLNPLAIAREIVALISLPTEIESINVAPPGFINITFKASWLAKLANIPNE